MSQWLDRRRHCLEVLELPEDASPLEIKTAYLHLKELYTKGSIAIVPVEDDYPEEAKLEIIKKIEEAYAWLSKNLTVPPNEKGDTNTRPGPGKATVETRQEIAEVTDFDGPTLRSIRMKLGIDAGEVEFATKISLNHIRNIEEDNFKALPEEVFIKGYLNAYAKCLGLDPEKVSEYYLARYRKGR